MTSVVPASAHDVQFGLATGVTMPWHFSCINMLRSMCHAAQAHDAIGLRESHQAAMLSPRCRSQQMGTVGLACAPG